MSTETIYDTKIAPLMAQILDICKEHKIAMLADFLLLDDAGEQLKCTSYLLGDEYSPDHAMLRAMECIRPQQRNPLSITITKQDGSKEVHTIIAGTSVADEVDNRPGLMNGTTNESETT